MRLKAVLTIMLTLLLMSMLTLAFAIQKAESSEPFVTEWARTYSGYGALSVIQTSDGGYALAGYTWSFGTNSWDSWLAKVDSSGNLNWNKTYGGAHNEWAYSIVETSDGGYAFTSFTRSFGAGGADFWLVKVDSSGNLEWNKTYGESKDDAAYSIVEASDGGYTLTGKTESFGAGATDFWLVKVDSSGNLNWNKTYGGTKEDAAESIMGTGDGGYTITGGTQSYGAGGWDFWLIKTNSAGNIAWNKTYGGASEDIAKSVVETSDGGYAIAGYTHSYGAGLEDFWLIKTDSVGNMQWNKAYGGTGSDLAYSLVQTSDGGYAIAGYTESYGAGNRDFWLVKVDSSGNLEWNKTYGEANTDAAQSIVETSDGGYALAGYKWSFEMGRTNCWLVKVGRSTPADNFGLFAPYITLASTIIIAIVATAIFFKYKKARAKRK